MKRTCLTLTTVAAIAVCGCSSAADTAADRKPPSRSAPTDAPPPPSLSASTPDQPDPPSCPNPEGGLCLGPVQAGQPYKTQLFSPQLTYRVPNDGWSNYEDTSGNFLLVPPRNDLPGVNGGTSDFLGVYTSIAPSRIVQAAGCITGLVPGAGRSPQVMAAWFARQRDLAASKPKPVVVGGLRGVVLDLRTAPRTSLTSCTVNGQRIELAGLFSGVAPSALDHAVIPGMTMRLFLLARERQVLGIELDDIDRAPGNLADLTAVARDITFG